MIEQFELKLIETDKKKTEVDELKEQIADLKRSLSCLRRAHFAAVGTQAEINRGVDKRIESIENNVKYTQQGIQ